MNNLVKSLLLLLVIFLLVGLAFYFFRGKSPILNQNFLSGPNLEGKIYLSAGKPKDILPTAYTLDLKTKEITKIPFGSTDFMGFFHKNIDGEEYFVGTSKDELVKSTKNGKTMNFDGAIQIYRKTGENMFSKITSDESVSKKHISISPNKQKIAYNYQDFELLDEENIFATKSYVTVIYDRQTGEYERITDAYMPTFLDNQNIVFLNDEAIYSYNINDKSKKTLIAGVKGTPFTVTSKISVSNDRQMLALTFPDANKVVVYALGKTAVPTLVSTFEEIAFWSLFSPEDDKLALQVLVGDVPTLVFYDLKKSKKMEGIIELKGYLNDSLFMTEWVK